MWRSVASNALTLFILIALGIVGIVAWGKKTYTEPGPLQVAICVRVDRGASIGQISDTLAQKDAISYGTIFRLGADYTKKSNQLKYGNYLVPAKASMSEIIDILTKGGQSTCGTEINYRIGVTDAQMVVRELDPATKDFTEIAKFDPTAADAGPAPEAYAKAEAMPDVRIRVILAEGVTSWQVDHALEAADFLTGKIASQPEEGSLAPESYEITKGETRA
ncbi:branched-chain alpha-keto acid dehydrogenase subunit E2, partial [Thioclava sp. BHET1]